MRTKTAKEITVHNYFVVYVRMTFGKPGIPGCGSEFMDMLQVTSRNCVNISITRLRIVACIYHFQNLAHQLQSSTNRYHSLLTLIKHHAHSVLTKLGCAPREPANTCQEMLVLVCLQHAKYICNNSIFESIARGNWSNPPTRHGFPQDELHIRINVMYTFRV